MTCPHCYRQMVMLRGEWACNHCGVRRASKPDDAERMAMELLKIPKSDFRSKGG